MSFYNEFVNPSALDSQVLDYQQSAIQSKGKGRMLSQPSIPSPATTNLPLDMEGEPQRIQPSHNYSQYKQQTGIPTPADHMRMVGSQQFNTGMNESLLYDNNMPTYGLTNFEMNSPQDLKWDSFLDNDAFDVNAQPTMPTRVFPGMHQQMASEAQKMRQQQFQLEAEQDRRSQSTRRPVDQRTEDTIHRVMSEIRRSSHISNESYSPPNPSSVLPHISRSKKDEDDMDEDEKLLNSEEGKKLSSKERRQLRNKVSARAFRSRRKEYISQLESEINGKSGEASELKRMNQALMEENARYKLFAQKLLAHPAFIPFMKDISSDPQLAEGFADLTGQSSTQRQMSKDIDPYSSQQYLGQSNTDVQIGMTLVPDIPVDLSGLNIDANWTIPNTRSNMGQYMQPQVFAVTEVPEPAEQIDFAALSGKPSEDFFTQFNEEEKATLPEVTMPSKESIDVPESPITENVEEEEFDESMILYAPARAPLRASASNLSAVTINEKSNQIELSIIGEHDTSYFSRLSARLESRSKRLESLLSGL